LPLLATSTDFAALCDTTTAAHSVAGVNAALAAASTAAERYCGRVFTSTTYTEYYDGNGYPNLPLNQFPVTAVDSVYLDGNGGYGQISGTFTSTQLLVQGEDFVIQYDLGYVQMLSSTRAWPFGFGFPGGSPWGWPGLTRRGTSWKGWPKIPGSIKVTYTAGYTTIPDDLKAAVCSMAAYILIVSDTGGLVNTSQTYIDVTTGSGFLAENLARGNVPALGSSRLILDTYREVKTNRGIF